MFNEDEVDLKNTLKGVMSNFWSLTDSSTANFTTEDFTVVLVCDGYERIPESFKKYARNKGFLDEEQLVEQGFMTKNSDGNYKPKPLDSLVVSQEASMVPQNLLQCFEATTADFGIEGFAGAEKPINLLFCIKQKNDGKINSHKWFFQGICDYLQPDYTLLLDIGTRPDHNSVLKLVNYFEANPQVGGLCGEIEAECVPGTFFESFIQAAQYYEYKSAYSPEKPCESLFGWTTALPGAYSMLRLKAVVGTPLDILFKNTSRSAQVMSCSEANEYLTEDRILCL